jgi:hypothetical protein
MNLLATRMPAAVVANVIGIGDDAADHRTRKAGGTWSNCPSLRS